jgi:hypothetical protein
MPVISTSLKARAAALGTVAGLFLSVFSVVALSGPGRIDISDGQTRYEVSRSLVDHGDSVIRNSAVWFNVFPGRDGQPYTFYRWPQSALGVLAVVAADVGGMSEERRHFFFALTSAAAAALLACVYLVWFRRGGLSQKHALFWAAAGIFCTPSWFYGTSTYDDILGALAVTAAIAVAGWRQGSGSHASGLCAGLLLGVAFNCKQPLAAFGLAVMACADDMRLSRAQRTARAMTIGVGLLLGIASYIAYDLWKFPPEVRAAHGPLLERYVRTFPGNPVIALAALALSPAAGVLWYCPVLPLTVQGLLQLAREHRRFVMAIVASIAVFLCVICSMSTFKGDSAWGPRYMTPVFAVLWLFAPNGAARWRIRDAAAVMAMGFLVQAAALTADPDRLYIQRRLPSVYGALAPVLYFDPANSHLLNRPREIFEIWKARDDPGERFNVSASPTAVARLLKASELGPEAVTKYKVFNSFRPWWANQWYLPASQRPVSLVTAVVVLVGIFLVGMGLLTAGARARDEYQASVRKEGQSETGFTASQQDRG